MNSSKKKSVEEAPQKRILVVDSHPLVRHGLENLIKSELGVVICGEAASSTEALGVMRDLNPDLIILEISLSGTNGIELLKLMKAEQPHLSFMVLSTHDESLYALRALKAGALGYVMKTESLAGLLQGIRTVLSGALYVSPKLNERLIFQAIQSVEAGMGSPVDKLSDREFEIFQLLGRRLGTKEIALELHLSIKTIETHRTHIKEKLHFKDGCEMIQFAIDWVAHEEDSSLLVL